MKTQFKLSLLLVLFLFSGITTYSQFTCGGGISEDDTYLVPLNGSCDKASLDYSNKYNTLEYNIPDANTPIKTIMVNINVFQKTDGSGNWQNTPDHIARLEQVISWVNSKYKNVTYPSDVLPGVEFISDSKIRIELANIYFYQNDDLWIENSITPIMNAIEAADPARLNQLNICITGGEFFASGFASYPSENNFSFNSYIMTFGNEANPESDYALAVHLAHELGHCFQLKHTYNSEYCQIDNPEFLDDVFGTEPCPDAPSGCDICYHDAGWSCDNTDPSNTCTNNLMGGTNTAGYISPKQMARIHRCMSLRSVRRYVKEMPKSPIPLEITSDETWDFNMKIYSDLIIKSGNTLTLQCELLMPTLGRIIVEPNAELIIDGGKVTKSGNEYWQGIEVWGNSQAHQQDINGENAQGKLTLINGAIIEYAENAITNWNPGHYNEIGGIIRANNADFINNRRSVEFMKYRNYHPYNPNIEFNYVGSFKDCSFKIDDQYAHTSNFAYHITMHNVKGITFTGCLFSNTTEMASTSAIYSLDAGFRVASYCSNSTSSPCADQDLVKCKFTGFYDAIRASNANSSNTVYIRDAIFTDNAYGVSLLSVRNATIVKSKFEISTCPETKEQCSVLNGIGIRLDQCSGYAIEENTFSNLQSAEEALYYGIQVVESDAILNEIYNNDFDHVKYAIQAERNNGLNNYNNGLSFLCNKFKNNEHDIRVYYNSIVSGNQGTNLLSAGNKFLGGSANNFTNLGNYLIDYYHSGGNTYPNIVTNVNRIFTLNANTCPSHYGTGNVIKSSSELLATENVYNENTTALSNVNSLYTALEDGGNTEQLNTEVVTSWPEEMWELRAELLNKSPHLSEKVLKTTANKTEVLPESVIFEILAANPHELKKDELLEFLKNKPQPLPDYMIELLKEYAYNPSYKSIIKSEMTNYRIKKERAAHDMIRHYLNGEQSEIAEVKNWLEKIGGVDADYQIIDLWLQENDTESANQLMDLIPDLYELTEENLVEHNQLKSLIEIQSNQINSGRSVYQTTEQEKSTLMAIAENSRGLAGRKAKNILSFVYGEKYCDCPEIGEGENKSSSAITQANDLKEDITLLNVTVSPNPAKAWTTFNFDLPLNVNTVYGSISDVQGKIVHTFQCENRQYVWNTKNLKNGVYLYTIIAGSKTESGKIIIDN